MAQSQKNQQKKVQKQKKREQRLKKKKVLESLPAHLSPIKDCFVYSELWERGIGTVIVTRCMAGGRLFMANYLLDVWFLGLKDAFVRETSDAELDIIISQASMDRCDAPYAKALITGAINYGESHGLKANWSNKEKRFVSDIRFTESDYEFNFGRDGKPFYINGPHDDEIIPKMTNSPDLLKFVDMMES